jgi:tagatose 6-phosphate kinase
MSFDRVMPDDVNRAGSVADYASGKSINVARVARALGEEVLASGFVGGSRGEQFCRDLDATGIRHDLVRVGGETRQCVTVIDRGAGTATELVEESAPVDADGWRALHEKLTTLLPAARVWVFSGTLPPGAPQDFYARWLPLAQQTGALAVLDARGEPMRLALQHPGFVLKINRDELAATAGEDLADESRLLAAMRRFCPGGGSIIITMGAGGALASDDRSAWRIISPCVQAVSAVGSGDAFAAGLAIGLSRGQALPDACGLAAACGAANAMTDRAGYLRTADVEVLRPQVRVSQLGV